MSSDFIEIDDIGKVEVKRLRSSRSIRLRITPSGNVAVTAPKYTPKTMIKGFVASKKSWILKHSKPVITIKAGDKIGTDHVVVVGGGTELKTRITKDKVLLTLPSDKHAGDHDVQSALKAACIRALKKQAKTYLPEAVADIAAAGAGEYKELKYKNMTSRWGSYSSNGTLSLSIYLLQLPRELIDYVIIHELCHSRHLNHSKEFWASVQIYCPNYKQLKKQLQKYRMTVTPS